MKVTIHLDRPLGAHDQPFTSTDYVRGVVDLDLQHEDVVSRITLELSGILYIQSKCRPAHGSKSFS